MLGNGDGTFKAAKNVATGGYPRSVLLADLNGDGKLDVLIPNGYSPGHVAVLLGNGDGTFKPPVNYGTDQTPQGMALGDLNGDGKLDLVTANEEGGFGQGSISVLLGNGDGSFKPATNIRVGTFPSHIVLADFNGDGKLDYALTSGGNPGTISIGLGNGDGTFKAPMNFTTGSYLSTLSAGDVNGDGKVDLVAASSGDNTVKILLGNGDGTFQAAQNISTHVSTPVAADLVDVTGDGKPDLAIGNYGSNNVSIFKNTYAMSPALVPLGQIGNPSGTVGAPSVSKAQVPDAPCTDTPVQTPDSSGHFLGQGLVLGRHVQGGVRQVWTPAVLDALFRQGHLPPWEIYLGG
jgi:hypothetical protein